MRCHISPSTSEAASRINSAGDASSLRLSMIKVACMRQLEHMRHSRQRAVAYLVEMPHAEALLHAGVVPEVLQQR